MEITSKVMYVLPFAVFAVGVAVEHVLPGTTTICGKCNLNW